MPTDGSNRIWVQAILSDTAWKVNGRFSSELPIRRAIEMLAGDLADQVNDSLEMDPGLDAADLSPLCLPYQNLNAEYPKPDSQQPLSSLRPSPAPDPPKPVLIVRFQPKAPVSKVIINHLEARSDKYDDTSNALKKSRELLRESREKEALLQRDVLQLQEQLAQRQARPNLAEEAREPVDSLTQSLDGMTLAASDGTKKAPQDQQTDPLKEMMKMLVELKAEQGKSNANIRELEAGLEKQKEDRQSMQAKMDELSAGLEKEREEKQKIQTEAGANIRELTAGLEKERDDKRKMRGTMDELKAALEKEKKVTQKMQTRLMAQEETIAALQANMSDTTEFIANGCREDTAAYYRIKIRHLINLAQAKLAYCADLSNAEERQAAVKWRVYCQSLEDIQLDDRTDTKVMQATRLIRANRKGKDVSATNALINSGALAALVDDSELRAAGDAAAHPGSVTQDNAPGYRIAVKSYAGSNQALGTSLNACVDFVIC